MEIVRQTEHGCLGACCAMLTGKPLQEVNEFFGHDGSETHFNMCEAFSFLWKSRVGVGIPGINNDDLNNGVFAVDFKDYKELTFLCDVVSEREDIRAAGGCHAVVIKMQRAPEGGFNYFVYDPKYDEIQGFGKYQVLTWYPILKVEGDLPVASQ